MTTNQIRIAKELLRIARNLVAADDMEREFEDFLKEVRRSISECISVDSSTPKETKVTGNFEKEIKLSEKKVTCGFSLSADDDGEDGKDNRIWLNYYFKSEGSLFDARVGAFTKLPFAYDRSKKSFSFSDENNANEFVEKMKKEAVDQFDDNTKVTDHCLNDLREFVFGA